MKKIASVKLREGVIPPGAEFGGSGFVDRFESDKLTEITLEAIEGLPMIKIKRAGHTLCLNASVFLASLVEA